MMRENTVQDRSKGKGKKKKKEKEKKIEVRVDQRLLTSNTAPTSF